MNIFMDVGCGWLGCSCQKEGGCSSRSLNHTPGILGCDNHNLVAGRVAGVVMFSHENILIAMANINLVFRVARNIYKPDSKKTLLI